MRTTDATRANSRYRKMRKAITLSATIAHRLSYYSRRCSAFLPPDCASAANAALADLSAYVNACLDEKGEINSSLSSRKMINQPIETTLTELFPGMPKPEKKQRNDMEEAVIQYMNQMGRDVRGTAHKTACTYEIAEKCKKNWAMVFNTLTVTDDTLSQVFNTESTAFKEYIRSVWRLIARNKKDTACHTYFACVEQGGKTGRLHIHVLHFMERLPKGAQDPNYGMQIAYRRELDIMKGVWKWGHSSPKIIRYSPHDKWGLEGYRWPYDREIKTDLAMKSPLAIAGYISKYITKSATTEKETYQWRIRKSHNLGHQILKELVALLPATTLQPLATLQTFPIKLNRSTPPAPLVRLHLLKRLSTIKSPSEFCQTANRYMPRLSPLRALRDSMNLETARSPQNSTISGILESDRDALFEAVLALKKAANKINAEYFPEVTTNGGRSFSSDLRI